MTRSKGEPSSPPSPPEPHDDKREKVLDVVFARARPLWGPCTGCEDPWCSRHHMHAFECPCPGTDELDFDPYTVSG